MNSTTVAFGALNVLLGAAVAALIHLCHRHAVRIVALEDENVVLVEKCLRFDNACRQAEAEAKVIRDENVALLNKRYEESPS